ncbi:MAG: sigma-70 family RNA polymerase sigma factor [Deltaproteobacteria bacterium]|nr:sigma-70 family RNA polymerase sigma factor [Deltaproteobacteria bacterium]
MVKALGEGKYNPKIREELDKADWQEISLHLLRYANSKTKMLRAMGITDVDPEDLIQEAILLAYGIGPNNTYRNWNKEVYPDLTGFLRSVIKSIVSHKMEKRKEIKAEPIDEAFDKDLMSLSPENPEALVSREHGLMKLKQAIYELIKGDEEVEMVWLCLEDGISKPQRIAEETGYDITTVNNALRRLRRKTKNLAPPT